MSNIRQRNCTICSVKYWKEAHDFLFRKKEVNFCPECWSELKKVVNITTERERKMNEMIEAIIGFDHVVINRCHGGFDLSHKAKIRYLDCIKATYTLIAKESRHDTERYGHTILVNGTFWDTSFIERNDPYLVQIVAEMGNKSWGPLAELKIVSVPADVQWEIEEYDGIEWISEKHRIWV